jgi:hypothetical protein
MNEDHRILCLLLGLILTYGCNSECKHEIEFYRGPSFNSGQHYIITVNDEEIINESFLFGTSDGKYVKKKSYCCKNDSCAVKFTLDGKDTVFYLNPKEVYKVVVASDLKGRHFVATNKEGWAWTEY